DFQTARSVETGALRRLKTRVTANIRRKSRTKSVNVRPVDRRWISDSRSRAQKSHRQFRSRADATGARARSRRSRDATQREFDGAGTPRGVAANAPGTDHDSGGRRAGDVGIARRKNGAPD